MAVSSPLLEASVDGAHGVLLSIAGGSDLGLFEINEAAALVAQAAHAEANIIFGAVIDDALGDEVRVTVIAAGFDGGMPKRRDSGSALRREPARQAEARSVPDHGAPGASGASQPAQQRTPAPVGSYAPSSRPTTGSPVNPSRLEPEPVGAAVGAGGSTSVTAAQPPRPRQVQYDDDDLDVPDFLK
jgi:cell division protein FtsZ